MPSVSIDPRRKIASFRGALNKILAVFTPISLWHSTRRNGALPHSRVYRLAAGQRTRKEIYGRGATPTSAAAVD